MVHQVRHERGRGCQLVSVATSMGAPDAEPADTWKPIVHDRRERCEGHEEGAVEQYTPVHQVLGKQLEDHVPDVGSGGQVDEA